MACYMSDKAAFVSSVYSRYRAQTSNVNVISPAFKRLLLAQSVKCPLKASVVMNPSAVYLQGGPTKTDLT